MDDVEITDEGGYHVEKEPPKNQDLTSLSLTAGELLSQYGWYLLLVSVLGYLLIQYLSKKRSSQSSQSSTPATPQDSAFVARRQEAMEAARRKMQVELDAKAVLFKEKQKQQEEEKRRQKIEIWDSMKQGKSYKGNAKPPQTTEEASSSTTAQKPTTDKKPLRSAGYNPLSGEAGGSCAWRPGRRGPSSGG
ncbi:selenoprotein S isoform X2 [Hippoglossus hippoglossus]|uniref:selenoprotein S n=1 Tax=Hippoglossus stenolepis TaxID=195615 RepID=UPI00148BA4B9|nr:selenoprotein S isoform X2 [Hippoglossus hippoglossus]XP_035017479.1 selenoprotein S [Hippoglossus stenolepis]